MSVLRPAHWLKRGPDPDFLSEKELSEHCIKPTPFTVMCGHGKRRLLSPFHFQDSIFQVGHYYETSLPKPWPKNAYFKSDDSSHHQQSEMTDPEVDIEEGNLDQSIDGDGDICMGGTENYPSDEVCKWPNNVPELIGQNLSIEEYMHLLQAQHRERTERAAAEAAEIQRLYEEEQNLARLEEAQRQQIEREALQQQKLERREIERQNIEESAQSLEAENELVVQNEEAKQEQEQVILDPQNSAQGQQCKSPSKEVRKQLAPQMEEDQPAANEPTVAKKGKPSSQIGKAPGPVRSTKSTGRIEKKKPKPYGAKPKAKQQSYEDFMKEYEEGKAKLPKRERREKEQKLKKERQDREISRLKHLKDFQEREKERALPGLCYRELDRLRNEDAEKRRKDQERLSMCEERAKKMAPDQRKTYLEGVQKIRETQQNLAAARQRRIANMVSEVSVDETIDLLTKTKVSERS